MTAVRVCTRCTLCTKSSSHCIAQSNAATVPSPECKQGLVLDILHKVQASIMQSSIGCCNGICSELQEPSYWSLNDCEMMTALACHR